MTQETHKADPTQAVWWNGRFRDAPPIAFIAEEPLSIRVQGKPYAVVMRTPGDDIALAAGFGLTEGLVDRREDIVALGCCEIDSTNVVTLTLTAQRQQAIAAHLDRRGYISQTSCGICGKSVVEELRQEITPLNDDTFIGLQAALDCLIHLGDLQPLRHETAATHAAALFDAHMDLLSVAEDVGRHNALDKAIGHLFYENRLDRAKAAALSSRISYELVQKAARARIPILLAVSRPTHLAVSLARELNITLAGFARPDGLYIYTHPQRLVQKPEDSRTGVAGNSQ